MGYNHIHTTIITESNRSVAVLITRLVFFLYLQNALAATASPFPGQYSGFEAAYPYATAAATGK